MESMSSVFGMLRCPLCLFRIERVGEEMRCTGTVPAGSKKEMGGCGPSG